MTVVMAHRGFSSQAPENTMAAFRLAMQNPDIGAIELDVQLTKDGVPVILHDYKVDRTTNGTGLVRELTAAEVQSLDAGSWFHPSFAGERIPLLEEVLRETKGRIPLHLELKKAGELYPELEKKVAALLAEWEMREQVQVTSFDHDAIRRMKDIDPAIRTGLIYSNKTTLLREQLQETGASMLCIQHPFLTRDTVEELLADGSIELVAWQMDEPETIERFAGMHPGLIFCSNYPDRVIDVLRSKGRLPSAPV
ncbi:glycerophosphoryl diester phosphodiesterase [Paenibacillus sp. J31TS4]|uniref:glycerophosphodiester phosphodiesterase n=1 Tax=Paenibacillus sp. J31TS4 TaxID=2807195 RepID=UPI001B0D7E40|nr:glycerophosphodiester phosphodiesterase family protein [Paenibacillus sp. J31TS4]GIP40398.1 glycerophosphoryl diester phosphodiesterase [Paenibacillus sp. J31TS4]